MSLGIGIGVPHGQEPVTSAGFNWLTDNLLSAPTDPATTPWAANTMTVATQGVSDPNGVSAYRFTNSGTGSDIIQGGISCAANESFKIRCVAQYANNAFIFLSLSDESSSNFGAYFNVDTGAVSASSAVGVGVVESTEINSLGNGWYECIVIGHFTAAKTASFDFRVPTASGSVSTTSTHAVVMAEPGVYQNS